MFEQQHIIRRFMLQISATHKFNFNCFAFLAFFHVCLNNSRKKQIWDKKKVDIQMHLKIVIKKTELFTYLD